MKDRKHDTEILNSFIKQHSSKDEFKASIDQMLGWEEFINRQPGINPLLIPVWAGQLLIQNAGLKALFMEMDVLSESEKLILYFTARGHDPKLITESIPGLSIQDYWKQLESARIALKRKLETVSDDELQGLEKELKNIAENWIQFSEEWASKADHQKNRRKVTFLLVLSLLVLAILYVFGWPFIFPFDGVAFFDQHQPEIILAIKELPPDELSVELLQLLDAQSYDECLDLLDEELVLQDQVPAAQIAFYIALLIRQGDYQEARHLLRTYQTSFSDSMESIYRGAIWKLRFHS